MVGCLYSSLSNGYQGDMPYSTIQRKSLLQSKVNKLGLLNAVCQNRAGIGPMPAALGRYWPVSGVLWHACRDSRFCYCNLQIIDYCWLFYRNSFLLWTQQYFWREGGRVHTSQDSSLRGRCGGVGAVGRRFEPTAWRSHESCGNHEMVPFRSLYISVLKGQLSDILCADSYRRIMFQLLSPRLWYLQCINTGDTAILH